MNSVFFIIWFENKLIVVVLLFIVVILFIGIGYMLSV